MRASVPAPLRCPLALVAGSLLLLAAGFLGACSPAGGSDSYPPGTVALVSGVPILKEVVDARIDELLVFEPAFTTTHRRRLFMTNIAIPMAYGISQAGNRRAQALQSAEEWLASPSSQPAPMEQLEFTDEGVWIDIGLDVWLAVRDLEVGQNSRVIELIGRYAVIRVLSRDNNPKPTLEQVRLMIESFPYDDSPETLVNRCLEGTLKIVDPAWNEIIPGTYKYMMKEQK
jgi:hypothetical protein